MKIATRAATWRRERRVLLRGSRTARRLDQAEREGSWAIARELLRKNGDQ
jgi:hypothetical protein